MEHFPISLDVEEGALGKVLKLLHSTPGIMNIHLQLMARGGALPKPVLPAFRQTVESVARRKATRERQRVGGLPSVRELVAQSLNEAGGPMHYNLLGKILERRGFSPTTIHSAITKMSSDKNITRVAPGTYRLTAKGERKYIQHEEMHPRGGNESHGSNNKRGVRLLVLTALSGKKYRYDELQGLLVENGFAAGNMYNGVKKMREEGLIRREGDTYEITDKGINAITPMEQMAHIEHQNSGEVVNG